MAKYKAQKHILIILSQQNHDIFRMFPYDFLYLGQVIKT